MKSIAIAAIALASCLPSSNDIKEATDGAIIMRDASRQTADAAPQAIALACDQTTPNGTEKYAWSNAVHAGDDITIVTCYAQAASPIYPSNMCYWSHDAMFDAGGGLFVLCGVEGSPSFPTSITVTKK